MIASAIRQLASSLDGSRIAAAEFEMTVSVWDITTCKRISTIETVIDFGDRLSISPDGRTVAAGSWHLEGVACYDADTTELLWATGGLGQVQHVQYLSGSSNIFCGAEKRAGVLLDARTGRIKKKINECRILYENPYQPKMMAFQTGQTSERPPKVVVQSKERCSATIENGGIVRSIAFNVDQLCVAEMKGPVYALNSTTMTEIWRYIPPSGALVNRLAYCEAIGQFVGLLNNFTKRSTSHLVVFDPISGKPTSRVPVEARDAQCAFCHRGSLILTTDGRLTDVTTGRAKRKLRFPTRKYPGR